MMFMYTIYEFCSPESKYLSYRSFFISQAEQKRRDAIKKGYDHLLELLPTGSLGGEEGGGGSSNPASPDDIPGGWNGKVYLTLSPT